MNDYARVAQRLNTVRRAWKRTAGLSGLAIVILESSGAFTLALLIDVLYRPRPPVRVGIFALAAAGLVYLLARHIVAPLLRRIGDEQVALYVEEHDARFEGALIAAAEFREGRYLSAQQADLVDAVIASAAKRAERLDLRKVIDLSRFHKYGVAAAIVLAVYFAAGLSFPKTVGHHAVRVLRPWEPTKEDRPAAEAEAAAQPIVFTLSREDSNILRGTPFDLEAILSRAPEAPVFLHFRSLGAEKGESRWRHLPMAEVEKLHGFRIAIPDVNEDMEFFVAAGEDRSATHRISVYDPLVLEGVEVVLRYPDYLKLADRTDIQVTGDVAAPIGSTVSLRVLTNRPLAEGTLEWEGGAKQPLRIDPKQNTSASASFEVQKDASYTFRVRDITDQKGESPGPAAVKALQDRPPAVQVSHPTETVELHPLGEAMVLADTVDDFGIASVDFVYMRASEETAKEIRVPMAVEQSGQPAPGVPVAGRARFDFRLEDLKPGPEPQESFAYYLEARDRKGQKALSDIFFLTVVQYETWATWDTHPAEAGEEPELKSLEPYFRATWHLHTQKDTLAPNDFNRQSEELAASMLDPATGQLYVFAKSHDPSKQEALRRIAGLVAKGHQALTVHDTGKALDAFRVALAEIARLGLDEVQPQIIPQGQVPMVAGEQLRQLAMIETARVKAEAMQAQLNAPAPEASQRDLAREAQRVAEQAQSLEQKQAEIVQQATEQAQGQQPPNAQGDNAQQQNQGGELAQKQQGVAQEARGVAEAAVADPAAAADPTVAEMARKINRAAADMQQAARKMQTGRIEQALPEAERARQTLREVRDQAAGLSQAKLERALDDAEARMERLLDQQQQARAGAEALDRANPQGKEPDPRQQRDFRVLAADQARLKTDLAQVNRDVENLKQWAEGGARPETAKHIDDAHRTMVRGRADQKMTNAVVELAALRAANAAAEQKRVEQTVSKALDEIRAANDSLASDIESELRRARNEGRRIETALERLGAQPQQPDGTEKKQEQPTPRLAPRDQAEKGEQAAYEIKRFTNHLENRDFAEPNDLASLKQAAQSPQQLGQQIAREDQKRQEVFRVVRRVRNKLEAEYEARLQAKKLFAAQREECPPQYRELVNKYYEALSQTR